MKITIHGKPIAKARPRFFRRGKFVGTYNAQETEEGRFMLEAKSQVKKMLEGPLFIKCVFRMPRPKSHYGTGKNQFQLKKNAPKHHTNKPDIDNLKKMVYDCLNGIAWKDDAQICQSYAQKVYSEHPQTEIIIHEVFDDAEKG